MNILSNHLFCQNSFSGSRGNVVYLYKFCIVSFKQQLVFTVQSYLILVFLVKSALLTLLRFSGVAAAELELECGLFLLWVPFDLLALEEEEDEEEEAAAGWGARVWWEDDTEEEEEEGWDGRLCDDDDGFFFFLTGVGASYVRKDSKDMVGISKSSSSSLAGESFGARGRPGNREANDKVNLAHWKVKK